MARNITTTIEITDTYIKLLQAKSQREPLISYGNAGKIEQANDDHVAGVLTQMVSTRGFEAGELIGIIPRRFAILKHLKLPSQSEVEIKRMLSLQIGTQVPYAREDIIFDSQIVARDLNGYSQVLLLVVHKD